MTMFNFQDPTSARSSYRCRRHRARPRRARNRSRSARADRTQYGAPGRPGRGHPRSRRLPSWPSAISRNAVRACGA